MGLHRKWIGERQVQLETWDGIGKDKMEMMMTVINNSNTHLWFNFQVVETKDYIGVVLVHIYTKLQK